MLRPALITVTATTDTLAMGTAVVDTVAAVQDAERLSRMLSAMAAVIQVVEHAERSFAMVAVTPGARPVELQFRTAVAGSPTAVRTPVIQIPAATP